MSAEVPADVLDDTAAVLWYAAGAVIPWEMAVPEVQARYRAKATVVLAAELGAGSDG